MLLTEYLLSFGPNHSTSFLASDIKIHDIHGTGTPPVALYGCDTWSLSLRKGNRVLWKLLGVRGRK